jgi:hypothetical protein
MIFELAGELAGAGYLVGTHLRPILVDLRGAVDRVGIRFQPGMASLLFGVSAREIRHRVAGFSDVGIRLPSSYLDLLMNAPGVSGRIGAIEDWLLGRLAGTNPVVFERQREIADLFLLATSGVGTRSLHDLTGWSARKTQRFFLEYFGAPVAKLRRWGRFRRSLAVLEAKNHPSRAILSTELGYSDQAHMCREFREFTGTDIGSLLAERRSVGNVQAAGQ